MPPKRNSRSGNAASSRICGDSALPHIGMFTTKRMTELLICEYSTVEHLRRRLDGRRLKTRRKSDKFIVRGTTYIELVIIMIPAFRILYPSSLQVQHFQSAFQAGGVMPMILTASKRTCATVLPAFLEFEQDIGYTLHISLNRTR
ncbi:uncharacterized protein STEHIDRAFT_112476 [Stereum hirsutum FP-91666 SS1]|uniref:uncharacterized protein n=1 Tax=Stereum hirsutum (strain FP-91666) TaxID=721885 RepID=UPI000444A1F8|nr:uncharacterized protein STEHIDRAFT_112476 [Stereum hirsutum FP-91666 SS1]EIM84965.1 hypothetical protein STEHIDRAFT_112476 [Stereum hirsutum FP-91666 SS1]